MENEQPQELNRPKFERLISACGMWAAIFLPVIIIIFAFIIPFGDWMTRSYILKLIVMFSGKLFLFFMISLPIWYGLSRVLQVLYDINIRPKRGKLLTYGLALAWTIHTWYILFLR